MAAGEDASLTKLVRSQIARRYIDSSLLDIRVSHGLVTLRGVIRVLRTHPDVDLQKEMETISIILRQKAGIRDVVWDVTRRT
jgi:hypothetical protein